MNSMDQKYLSPTSIIDSDHPTVIEYANKTVKDAGSDPVAQAVKLYYAVRDNIWYDPYYPFYLAGALPGQQYHQLRPGILHQQSRAPLCPGKGLRNSLQGGLCHG